MKIIQFLFGLPKELLSHFTNKTVTLHPNKNKKGVRMSKGTYDLVKRIILDLLKKEKDVTNIQLQQFVESKLRNKLGDAISWYYIAVRYDLEARRIIKYISDMSPHRIRLN